MVLHTKVLDMLVAPSPVGNSSAVVCARVVAKRLLFGLVSQHGPVIDWGSALTHLAENALRQVSNMLYLWRCAFHCLSLETV